MPRYVSAHFQVDWQHVLRLELEKSDFEADSRQYWFTDLDKDGYTILHSAVIAGLTEACKLFLEVWSISQRC